MFTGTGLMVVTSGHILVHEKAPHMHSIPFLASVHISFPTQFKK